MSSALLKNGSDRRDARVELMRLLACFGVIFIHLPDKTGEFFSYKRMFDVLNACAVPIFFTITGAFWFRTKRSYGQVVWHFIKTVCFPVALCVTIAQVLRTWIYSPLVEIPQYMLTAPDPLMTLRGFIQLDFDQWYAIGGHVWYVTAMMELVLFYIPMKLIARCEDRKIRYGFTAFIFISVMIYNLDSLLPAEIVQYFPSYQKVFPSYFVMLMIGQEMYAHRDLYARRKFSLIGAAGFIIICAVRHMLDDYSNPDKPVLSIISIFSFLSLIAIWMTFMPMNIPDRFSRIIRFLSSYTFGVYLIHPMFLTKLSYLGMIDIVSGWCEHLTPVTAINYAAYALICGLFVFLCCIAVLIPCRLIKNLFMKLLLRKAN